MSRTLFLLFVLLVSLTALHAVTASPWYSPFLAALCVIALTALIQHSKDTDDL